jgi:hypothetical protein
LAIFVVKYLLLFGCGSAAARLFVAFVVKISFSPLVAALPRCISAVKRNK